MSLTKDLREGTKSLVRVEPGTKDKPANSVKERTELNGGYEDRFPMLGWRKVRESKKT